VILITAVQSHQGVEQEELGAQVLDGVGKPAPVGFEVEAQDRCGDDVDGRRGQVEASVSAQALEALTHEAGMVFGEEDEDGPGLGDFEGIEAGGCGGDGQSEVEAEPGLTQLGGAGEEADGGAAPQGLDEPARLGVGRVELAGQAHRQGFEVHG
jgi:hypothetical protein